MRLSSLSVAVILLSSSVGLAQHAAPSGSSSAPAPSAVPSAASPAPAAAPAAAPSASAGHSESSSPVPASAPESHAAPSASSFDNHSSGSVSADSSRAAPVAQSPHSDPQGVTLEEKVSGDGRITSAARVGEYPPEKDGELKPAQPNLRHWVCEGCKPAKTEESDLRHRMCLNGPCTCPSGQTATKGGCVPVAEQCSTGQTLYGGSCVTSAQCPAGQYWSGANCTLFSPECVGINGRAATVIAELRSLGERMRQACSQDPSGDECEALKQEREGVLERYQRLLGETSATCRATLPDPMSVI